jgi:hypothetical protein
VKQEGRLTGTVLAALVAGALLLAASGSALAAGGKSIGTDEFRAGRPALAGKMGGTAAGLGALQISCQEEVHDHDSALATDGPGALGGKLGIGSGQE